MSYRGFNYNEGLTAAGHGAVMARNDATVGHYCSSAHDDFLRNIGVNKPARDMRMRVFGTSPKIDGKWGNGHETWRE